MGAPEYVIISVIGQHTHVLPDNKIIVPGRPLNLTITYLEDNIDIRKAISEAVRVGLLKAEYRNTVLSPEQIINIDEIRELTEVGNGSGESGGGGGSGGEGGGGGSDSNAVILAASTVYILASEENPVSSVYIGFLNPNNDRFGFAVTVDQNVNTYFGDLTNNGFNVYFSAPITQNFRLSYVVVKAVEPPV
jgi:hypothetical protein